MSSPKPASACTSDSEGPLVTLSHSKEPLSILLVDTSTFTHTCQAEGAQTYQLTPSSLCAHSVNTMSTPRDLSTVLKEYHGFVDVFSKAKAKELALHHPYDLSISLEEGSTLPHSLIYSLSQAEL